MQKHKELREKFGNVLPTDDTVEVLEAIEQWLIERENQVLRIHDVVGRSKQLKAFREWWNKDNEGVCTTITHKDIERYLKSL